MTLWSPLYCVCVSAQILELLVQKSLTSANPDYTRPGDAFRRVMECVASGIFLPGIYRVYSNKWSLLVRDVYVD